MMTTRHMLLGCLHDENQVATSIKQMLNNPNKANTIPTPKRQCRISTSPNQVILTDDEAIYNTHFKNVLLEVNRITAISPGKKRQKKRSSMAPRIETDRYSASGIELTV